MKTRRKESIRNGIVAVCRFLVIVALAISASCHFIIDIPDESPAWSTDGGDGDTDGDSDGDSDSDVDIDGDVDGDTDVDADIDTSSPLYCPGHPEMIRIVELSNICIDRWEASEGGGSQMNTIPGARPWSNINFDRASQECQEAGKRLCSAGEWRIACEGGADLDYPYGETYSDGACNGSGYEGDSWTYTGSIESCEGGYDFLFDMSGNVAEWVDECNTGWCYTYGGSYGSNLSELRCDSSISNDATFGYDQVGFRCCLTL
jgi:hypothetical protein